MAEKETLHLVHELSKTEDDERRLEIISKLRDVKMTYDILVSTKVGSAIKPLKKLPDEKLASAAIELLRKWRVIADNYVPPLVKKETKPQKLKEEKPKQPVPPPPSSSDSSTVIKTEVNLNASEYTTELEATRSGYRDMLRQKLDDGNANKIPLHGIAESVELAIYTWSCKQPGDSIKSYTVKCRALVFNLKKNEQLRSRVRSCEVDGSTLVLMSKDELADASVSKERAAMAEKLGAEVALDYAKRDDVVAKKWAACGITEVVNMFKCEKCGSRNLHHTERQTRSADEPMTQFFQCLECGNQWRMN